MSYVYPPSLYYGFNNTYPYKQSHKKTKDTYIMKLYGNGSIKATPDIALVTLGIETESENLSTAQKENATKSNNVISILEDNGIKKEDIKTTSFLITPEYDYIEGRKVFKGYKVTNALTITIRNIGETGDIIDAAVEAGANKVNDIEFAVSKPDQYYNIALNRAISDSIEKAENISKTLNVTLNKIPIKIDEERVQYAPVSRAYLESTTTPIMKGTLEFNATIIAVFSYNNHQDN